VQGRRGAVQDASVGAPVNQSINAGPKVVDYKLMELALELVCNKTKGDAGQISALGSEAMKKKPKSL